MRFLNKLKPHPMLAEALAKFWMIIASCIIGINLFIVLTLMQMAPKLQVITQLLSSPMDTSGFIQTQPFTSSNSDKSLIDETILRYYLDMRLSQFPDEYEMTYRWGIGGLVHRLSSQSVFSPFYKGFEERIKAIKSNPETKSVEITYISRLDNTFTVELTVYTYLNGGIRKESYTAIIEVSYAPGRVFYRQLLNNPYGMYISKYNISKKR